MCGFAVGICVFQLHFVINSRHLAFGQLGLCARFGKLCSYCALVFKKPGVCDNLPQLLPPPMTCDTCSAPHYAKLSCPCVSDTTVRDCLQQVSTPYDSAVALRDALKRVFKLFPSRVPCQSALVQLHQKHTPVPVHLFAKHFEEAYKRSCGRKLAQRKARVVRPAADAAGPASSPAAADAAPSPHRRSRSSTSSADDETSESSAAFGAVGLVATRLRERSRQRAALRAERCVPAAETQSACDDWLYDDDTE